MSDKEKDIDPVSVDLEIDPTMIEQVSVVPPDGIMLINGIGLRFDFPSPERMNALQWNQKEKRGHIEYFTDMGTMENKVLSEADYGESVLPFICLYAQEQARQWARKLENYKQAVTDFDSENQRMRRLKYFRDNILRKTDFLVLPDVASEIPENILRLIYKYRKMVRDIADQAGAPWDGGGAKTPWPKPPIDALKKQERNAESDYDTFIKLCEPHKPVFTGVPLDRQFYEIYKQYGVKND